MLFCLATWVKVFRFILGVRIQNTDIFLISFLVYRMTNNCSNLYPKKCMHTAGVLRYFESSGFFSKEHFEHIKHTIRIMNKKNIFTQKRLLTSAYGHTIIVFNRALGVCSLLNYILH